MHWPPNAEGVSWFAKQVWPRLARLSKSAVFTVVGKGAPTAVRSLEEAGRVEVMGYVDDLDAVLDETAVFIVPLLSGAGMRVKILDAWSAGLPVISTTVGAEGMLYRDGENLSIADSAEAFANAAARLLGDKASAKRIGEAGRATVEQFYDWRNVYKAWDAIYN
jgi:glycosyltransferase involved in cell wall biosynthesis